MIKKNYIGFILCIVPFWTQCIDYPVTVIIPSHNNRAWYQKNLDSVLMQQYQHSRIIYIDDASDDGTYEAVCSYLDEKKTTIPIQVKKNRERRGALANIYAAVHSIPDNEIVCILDGDDWLTHDHVLSTINSVYQDPNVWLTYGEAHIYPSGERIVANNYPEIVKQGRSYRRYDWISSAPRTFWAGLFKQIRLADLLYEGTFFQASSDVAYLFPLLEMADGRYACIHSCLYTYNCQTTENDFKKNPVAQWRLDKYIRSKKRYLPTNQINPCNTHPKEISIITFVHKNITLNYSFQKDGNNLSIYIVPFSAPDFKQKLESILQSTGQYTAFVLEECLPLNLNDFINAAKWLEETGALGCTISSSAPCLFKQKNKGSTPPLNHLSDSVIAWNYAYGSFDWKTPFNAFASIYQTQEIVYRAQPFSYVSAEDFFSILNGSFVSLDAVGLLLNSSSQYPKYQDPQNRLWNSGQTIQ